MPASRKHDPSIPSWIDQEKLPKGAYWNGRDGYWYTLIRKPRARRVRIASGNATLWDLAEALGSPLVSNEATLAKLMHDFSRSDKFKRLAISTQEGYRYSSLAVQRFPIGPNRHFSDTKVDEVTTLSLQRMVDDIATTHRSKANLVKRYLSTAFVWGINHGLAKSNPVAYVISAKPHQGIDDGVVFAVRNVPKTKPIGTHRLKWIADNLGNWIFEAREIIVKSVRLGEQLTADAGIYFLIADGAICYVGQASCIRTRVGEHASNGVKFDSVAAIRGVPKWAMDEIEQCYIARLNPPLNLERSRFGQLYEIEGIERYISP